MIRFKIDTSALDQFQAKIENFKQKMEDEVENLVQETHLFMIEQAQKKLNTTQDIFINAISVDNVGDGIWEFKLDKSAQWIEEGLPAGFDMLDGLLASSKAKQGKNGKYVIVPFKHSKGGKMSPQQQALVRKIKSELKSRGATLKKIERNPDGSPKTGLIHKFDIQTADRIKTGKGAGKALAADIVPKGHQGAAGRPYLWGVRVYQKMEERESGGTSVRRDVMTFRTASESQRGRKWIHPGLKAAGIFEDAMERAREKLAQEILPKVLSDE